jgi:hypothetical protein
MSGKVKSYRVATAIAKAMTTKPPLDDYCGFAWDVGNTLAYLSNERNSPYNFEAQYLALGILSWIESKERELDAREAAGEFDPPSDDGTPAARTIVRTDLARNH